MSFPFTSKSFPSGFACYVPKMSSKCKLAVKSVYSGWDLSGTSPSIVRIYILSFTQRHVKTQEFLTIFCCLLLCFLSSWCAVFDFLSFRTPFKTFLFLPAQRWGWMMVGNIGWKRNIIELSLRKQHVQSTTEVTSQDVRVPEFTHKCEFLLNDLSLHRRRLWFWEMLSPGPEGGGGVAVEEIRCRLPILNKLVFHLNLFPITSNNWLALRKTVCFIILKGVENVSREEQGYS